MPHDLATANRHDHAWTENWAPNIWMLYTVLSPMWPQYAQRQSDRTDQIYGTKGAWKNSPTCYALLNGGFMAILRRADYFILIWTCSAVLPVSRYCHFSKLSPIRNKTHKKQERSFVLLPCCARKRCLLSCMVGLVQLPDSTRVICFQGYEPCGCQG